MDQTDWVLEVDGREYARGHREHLVAARDTVRGRRSRLYRANRDKPLADKLKHSARVPREPSTPSTPSVRAYCAWLLADRTRHAYVFEPSSSGRQARDAAAHEIAVAMQGRGDQYHIVPIADYAGAIEEGAG